MEKEAQEICRYSEDMQLCKVYANDPKVFAVDDILDVRAITTEVFNITMFNVEIFEQQKFLK